MEYKDLIFLTNYIIEKYHNPLREDLDKLSPLLDKIVEVHGTSHSEFENIRNIFLKFKEEMIKHLFKEENVLFPSMKEIQNSFNESKKLPVFHFGTIKNPINKMEFEHTNFDNYLSQIKVLSNDFFILEDACNTYATSYKLLKKIYNDTIEHATFENDVLHKLAIETENKINTKNQNL
jgi:regulator of cell morphogenesis and NO signaling